MLISHILLEDELPDLGHFEYQASYLIVGSNPARSTIIYVDNSNHSDGSDGRWEEEKRKGKWFQLISHNPDLIVIHIVLYPTLVYHWDLDPFGLCADRPSSGHTAPW